MSRLHRARGPVTLIGGGPVDAGLLARALALAPEAVGADGGGDVALPAGVDFAAVIGDMDSLRGAEALRARGVALHEIAAIEEQDNTDLEKCLRFVEAPLFVGVGFLGGRIDHHLAAMNALAREKRPVVLLGQEDVCFRCPRELELELAAGTRVSLFPMAPLKGVVSEGLRWSVSGLAMAPAGRIGTSNQALGGPMRLAFDGPEMLVVLPQAMLATVVGRLAPPA